jgi:uncharacterized delta-60 repeat protein
MGHMTPQLLKDDPMTSFSNTSLRAFLIILVGWVLWPEATMATAGAVDPSYGSGGKYSNPESLFGGVVLPDGSAVTVVKDSSRFRVFRVDPDGRPDLSFGSSGVAEFHLDLPQNQWVTASAAAVDGSTYHAFHDRLVHITSTGTLDTIFGTDGVKWFTKPTGSASILVIESLAPMDDGRIMVLVVIRSEFWGCASERKIFRLRADGQPDSQFGNAGSLPWPLIQGQCGDLGAQGLEPLANGYLRLMGEAEDRMLDRRGNPASIPAAVLERFRGPPIIWADALRERNYLTGALAGSSGQIAVARLNADLSQDFGFGTSGGLSVTDMAKAVRPTSENHWPTEFLSSSSGSNRTYMYVGAYLTDTRSTAVARLHSNGSLDTTFGTDGFIVLPSYLSLVGEAADGMPILSYWRDSRPDEGRWHLFRLLGTDSATGMGVISLVAPAVYSDVSEGNALLVTVARELGSVGEAGVRIRLTPSSGATPGVDYQDRTFEVHWGDGESGPVSFDIPILTDDLKEGVEGIEIAVELTHGNALLIQGQAQVRITDVPPIGSAPLPPVPVQAPSPPTIATPVVGGGGSMDAALIALLGALCLFRAGRAAGTRAWPAPARGGAAAGHPETRDAGGA